MIKFKSLFTFAQQQNMRPMCPYIRQRKDEAASV